ncbi:MAG TPA: aminodeoxychorismate synthase component I [Dehalococcoidia bacterium]|nr:aminodeoxychorismate synthase component I [Dehalococcoidia bacterium]
MARRPLVEGIDLPLSAVQAFQVFKDRPFCFFLDSGMDPHKLGRYSFLGAEPFLVLKSRGPEITLLQANDEAQVEKGNPFDVLRDALNAYRLDSGPAPIPLVGGAVGYFSYDLCHFIEKLPSSAIDDLELPECYLGLYDVVVAFDHLANKVYIASTGFPELEEARRLHRARERLEETRRLLTSAQGLIPARHEPEIYSQIEIRANFTRDEYLEAVARTREYICAGDIFQANISQRFEAELGVAPDELYLKLRQVNPAPFAAFLSYPEAAILSASPERFLKVSGDWVETRPIKGTRPRGRTPEADQALARELLGSVKDRAENIMIVDLERNDIGRVCRYGTVRVLELAILETYPTVFHLVSTVVGQLRPDKDRIDLLKASFPGGSVTGAPKVRAMEIIDELEPTRRSVYTGSIGYLSFDGGMDLSIVIRTFIVRGGRAYFQVGGGIVYDSEPEAEYMETLDKAKALVQALNLSAKVAVEAKA